MKISYTTYYYNIYSLDYYNLLQHKVMHQKTFTLELFLFSRLSAIHFPKGFLSLWLLILSHEKKLESSHMKLQICIYIHTEMDETISDTH